ncbi:hypothetical protein [Burkholderia sp. MSMB1552]|uniref:hypothetical protein n=1 Tax=Burkholderia sp. MSMB1552 TaxID=1636424 RepID=UPI003FA46DB3
MGSRKHSSQRTGRSGLTREMLLPLPTEKVRALSLENHLALATVRGDRGPRPKWLADKNLDDYRIDRVPKPWWPGEEAA